MGTGHVKENVCVEEVLQSDCCGGKMKAHGSKCSRPLLTTTIGCLFLSNAIPYIGGFLKWGSPKMAGLYISENLKHKWMIRGSRRWEIRSGPTTSSPIQPQVITPFSSLAAAAVARRGTFRRRQALRRSCTTGACGRSTSRRSLVRLGMRQSHSLGAVKRG